MSLECGSELEIVGGVGASRGESVLLFKVVERGCSTTVELSGGRAGDLSGLRRLEVEELGCRSGLAPGAPGGHEDGGGGGSRGDGGGAGDLGAGRHWARARGVVEGLLGEGLLGEGLLLRGGAEGLLLLEGGLVGVDAEFEVGRGALDGGDWSGDCGAGYWASAARDDYAACVAGRELSDREWKS